MSEGGGTAARRPSPEPRTSSIAIVPLGHDQSVWREWCGILHLGPADRCCNTVCARRWCCLSVHVYQLSSVTIPLLYLSLPRSILPARETRNPTLVQTITSRCSEGRPHEHILYQQGERHISSPPVLRHTFRPRPTPSPDRNDKTPHTSASQALGGADEGYANIGRIDIV
jgi:hypothetical protein